LVYVVNIIDLNIENNDDIESRVVAMARISNTKGRGIPHQYRMHSIKKDNSYMELGDLFYQVLSKFIASEGVPKYFGINQKLYPSEIHMIYAIGKHPGINVTDLAKFLGITKGAVPKMIKKLKSKGLVESFEDDGNRKEVHLGLTADGKKAHKGYLQYHATRNGFLKRYYDRLTKDKVTVITKMLKELGSYADMILEE